MVNSIRNKLLREENEYFHQKIDTICIKELKNFQHLGRKIGPFKVGHPYSLDNYIARILIKEGYIRFDDGNQITAKTIQKINFRESTNRELGNIPKNHKHVYIQAHQELRLLNTQSEEGKKPKKDFKQLYSDINDLIRVRLAKIIRFAIQTQNIQSKKALTSEELILFEGLSKQIKEWRDYLGSI